MTISELPNAKNSLPRSPICVLNASSYMGFWILKGLLSRGSSVHAAVQNNGETEIMKNIKEMGKLEKRLELFVVDILDYLSILGALKGCSSLFCCLDSLDGYDENMVDLEVRGVINVMEACAQTESVEKMVFSSSDFPHKGHPIGLYKVFNMVSTGAAQMCENGVLACVDVHFLTDVHIRSV